MHSGKIPFPQNSLHLSATITEFLRNWFYFKNLRNRFAGMEYIAKSYKYVDFFQKICLQIYSHFSVFVKKNLDCYMYHLYLYYIFHLYFKWFSVYSISVRDNRETDNCSHCILHVYYICGPYSTDL